MMEQDQLWLRNEYSPIYDAILGLCDNCLHVPHVHQALAQLLVRVSDEVEGDGQLVQCEVGA